MKHFQLRGFSIAAAACLAMGCAVPMGGPGASSPGGGAGGASSSTSSAQSRDPITQAQLDQFLKNEAETEDATGENTDREASRQEKELLKLLNASAGKQPLSQGFPVPEPASASIKALRAAKVSLRIQPVVDDDGLPVAQDFLQMKDSYTERAMVIGRKVADGTASAAERKEMDRGRRFASKLNDLKMLVSTLSSATMSANQGVPNTALETLFRVTSMMHGRQIYALEMKDDAYARVARMLQRQRRLEAIAGATMGLMATYMAVVNDGGDPRAIDALTEKAVRAFPLKAVVTDQEAREYVKNIDQNIAVVKKQYETAMRAVHGDAVYEKRYRAGIDALFASHDTFKAGMAARADATKATDDGRQADLASCARGERAANASVSPAECKRIHTGALAGHGPPPAGAAEAAAGPSVPGAAPTAGNVMGALLDSSMKLPFPGLAVIKGSLAGIDAIAKGDSKGALDAALTVVPAVVAFVPGGQAIASQVETAKKIVGTAADVVAAGRAIAAAPDGMAALREGLGAAQKMLAGTKYDPAKLRVPLIAPM